MKDIVIGITGNMAYLNEKSFLGYERLYLSQDYVNSVINANAIPYVLPITENLQVIKEYAKRIDGLIISGGYDVNPKLYNEEPDKLLGEIMPKRDFFESNLIKEVYKLKKPIFGICRGLQLINVVFGGSLYQDLSRADFIKIKHEQDAKWDIAIHSVKLSGILKSLLNEDIYYVNSFHHQMIKQLANNFDIVAKAKDGAIEAIHYNKDDSFIFAVQWHPEMMTNNDENARKIFNMFVDKVNEVKNK